MAKRVVLELSSSTNFVYSLNRRMLHTQHTPVIKARIYKSSKVFSL